MAEDSKIQWCDSTFNPWEGCSKVSPGCLHCYAETRNARWNGGSAPNWGKGAPRRRTSAANWKKPLKWNREAKCKLDTDGDGNCHIHPQGCPRPRVFCASLADWLDEEVPIEWLADLLDLIRLTSNLDWLLLTKRPQNFRHRLALAYDMEIRRNGLRMWMAEWFHGKPIPSNVWVGTTVEDQTRADERIPQLIEIPSKVRFLSCEPLLGPVDMEKAIAHPMWGWSKEDGIHWLIAGGESGPGCRPMEIEWARSLKDQCHAAQVPFFMKQLGGTSSHRGELSDFPADLRVRQFPTTTTA